MRLSAPVRTVPLSAIEASSPAELEGELAGTGKQADHMVASPADDGGVEWLAYPAGGGAPAHLATPPP